MRKTLVEFWLNFLCNFYKNIIGWSKTWLDFLRQLHDDKLVFIFTYTVKVTHRMTKQQLLDFNKFFLEYFSWNIFPTLRLFGVMTTLFFSSIIDAFTTKFVIFKKRILSYLLIMFTKYKEKLLSKSHLFRLVFFFLALFGLQLFFYLLIF